MTVINYKLPIFQLQLCSYELDLTRHMFTNKLKVIKLNKQQVPSTPTSVIISNYY